MYEIYIIKHLQWQPPSGQRFGNKLVRDFKASHESHYSTLKLVEDTLSEYRIRYCTVDRKRDLDYKPYDLIITVGGDGTFLSAAGKSSKQSILGVNSNPKVSVGRFCAARKDNFREIFLLMLKGKHKIFQLNRLKLSLNRHQIKATALNDILICHRNPSAMSQYKLCIGKRMESQRSSGIWISTAAGSTGAILSANGKVMPLKSNQIQYKPRELYWRNGRPYKMNGSIISGNGGLNIHSQMEDGMIYVDGQRISLPFCHGDVASIKNMPIPVNVVDYKNWLRVHHLQRK